MIIKISPENEFEAQKVKEVEHTGVKEFFMFGNKKDSEGDLIDFHDWSGSYRYLEGSLYFFLTNISEDKKGKSQKTNEITIQPQALTKHPLIKKGKVDNQDVKIINVEEIANKTYAEMPDKTVPFPQPPLKINETVSSPAVDDDNLGAEDKE